MASREERILNLANTLKSSGLAKSDVQARMMAEDMVGVEENVQKRYDEEHTRAHEYLRTTKNLGDPRFKEAETPVEKKTIAPIPAGSNSFENKIKPVELAAHDKTVQLGEVKTDVNLGGGSLKDLMLNQIKEDNHEIKNIEELKPNNQINEPSKVSDVALPVVEDINSSKVEEEKVSEEKTSVEEPSQGLDSAKLQAMMEEDGPLEEHTREIKGKPEIVKPREDYEENKVDLSNMFNFSKK